MFGLIFTIVHNSFNQSIWFFFSHKMLTYRKQHLYKIDFSYSLTNIIITLLWLLVLLILGWCWNNKHGYSDQCTLDITLSCTLLLAICTFCLACGGLWSHLRTNLLWAISEQAAKPVILDGLWGITWFRHTIVCGHCEPASYRRRPEKRSSSAKHLCGCVIKMETHICAWWKSKYHHQRIFPGTFLEDIWTNTKYTL